MKNRIVIVFIACALLLCACDSKSDNNNSNEVASFEFEEVNTNLGEGDELSSEVASPEKDTNNIDPEIAHPTNTYVMSSLDIELDLVEIESTFLQDRLKNEDLTTVEMNSIVADWYNLWDTELNSLWSRFWELADSDTRDIRLSEQREWIKTKETVSKEAASMYTGGSLYNMVLVQSQAKLTRLRCYDIAALLGSLTGETVKMPTVEYDGYYVDTQGTMEAYSDLTITTAPDDFYEIEIGLYRLTTLTGYATLENGILKFIDESMNANIKGDILIDGDTATFTITESEWEYLAPGDIYNFNEKWN